MSAISLGCARTVREFKEGSHSDPSSGEFRRLARIRRGLS